MLIKRKVNSVFVNQAASRFPKDNNRHMPGIQETSEKKKSCGEIDWKLFLFLIHKIGQQRLSNATVLIKPKHSPWLCKQGCFVFYFLPSETEK